VCVCVCVCLYWGGHNAAGPGHQTTGECGACVLLGLFGLLVFLGGAREEVAIWRVCAIRVIRGSRAIAWLRGFVCV
jgi:hypothetical protein